jgi:hypothetical protein
MHLPQIYANPAPQGHYLSLHRSTRPERDDRYLMPGADGYYRRYLFGRMGINDQVGRLAGVVAVANAVFPAQGLVLCYPLAQQVIQFISKGLERLSGHAWDG